MDRINHNPSIGAAFGSPTYPAEISNPTFLPYDPGPFISGTRTPPERPGTNKRKLTLLALIDELTQLRDEEQEKEKDINYGPIEDHRLSSDSEGAERFRVFDERIRNLDIKLLAFSNAMRQLGSSAGLMNAAYHLRARLAQIQYFFRENAAELFDPISHAPNLGTKPYSTPKPENVQRYASSSSSINNKPWLDDTEHLPHELERLANDLHVFLDRLNEVSDFTDEAVNASIIAFEGDLKYRASCLQEFEGQLKFVAVAQHVNDLTEDLGVHLDSVGASLNIFVEAAVPRMRLSQERAAAGLLNLSAVATFFSGLYSYQLSV